MNESCTIKPLPLFKGERRTYRGILQPFADHAHSHYVFGIVREGERELVLNGELLRIKKGDILVFNPGDAHGCTQASESPFAYDSSRLRQKSSMASGLTFRAIPTICRANSLKRYSLFSTDAKKRTH